MPRRGDYQTGGTTIRSATSGDIEALCGLYAEFHEFHVRGVPDRLSSVRDSSASASAKLRDRVREIMAAPDSAILVGERDGRIIGLAEVYARDDDCGPGRIPRRFGHLQSMVVAEGHREAGVGRALLNAGESWARGRGATEMRLDISESPDGPLGFYERRGYRTLRRTLVRKLE